MTPCMVLALSLACLTEAEPSGSQAIPPTKVRRVIAGILKAAEQNAARGRDQLQGDALADRYIRQAAAAALAEGASPRAFLLALGVALDDTDVLRGNPFVRPYLAQIESDAERQRRLRVLGRPSLRKRGDWLQHFVVSAALTAQFGAESAERLGILKETLDAKGDSGFSFADLAADYAGAAFATALLEDPKEGTQRLRLLAAAFRGSDFLPRVEDLEEGLSWQRFQEQYGGTEDPRFRRACEAIRRRVSQAPGWQWTEP